MYVPLFISGPCMTPAAAPTDRKRDTRRNKSETCAQPFYPCRCSKQVKTCWQMTSWNVPWLCRVRRGSSNVRRHSKLGPVVWRLNDHETEWRWRHAMISYLKGGRPYESKYSAYPKSEKQTATQREPGIWCLSRLMTIWMYSFYCNVSRIINFNMSGEFNIQNARYRFRERLFKQCFDTHITLTR
jgi:hypothetical protein